MHIYIISCFYLCWHVNNFCIMYICMYICYVPVSYVNFFWCTNAYMYVCIYALLLIPTVIYLKKYLQLDGISRHDLGREEFMKKVWEWKNVYGNRITSQIRYLGASVDWSRGLILRLHTHIHIPYTYIQLY